MKHLVRRALDWPPVWLIAALLATYGLRSAQDWPLIGRAADWLGPALVALGLALMLLAVITMAGARTTVVPRQEPAALVTGGIFGWTRNPIYLGDALVLLGAILWWRAALALPLVPIFVAVIQIRFIAGEEAMLRRHFGAQFDRYAARVRRWI